MNRNLVIAQTQPVGTNVAAILGDGSAKITGGGGWTVVARPKWVGYTEWEGIEPYTMTIPLLFDGHSEDRSVEGEIQTLNAMMRPAEVPKSRNPIVRILGHVPHTELDWVISDISWGDIIRREDGQTTRQFFELTLLEYVGVDILVPTMPAATPAAQAAAVAAPENAPAGAAPSSSRTYTVKKGDTLSAIAARELGSSNRWQEIASLNGVRDPKRLAIGQVLRLP